MRIFESRRVRHFVVRLDPGEELHGALLRALDRAEARSAWISGAGFVETAELAVFDPASRSHHAVRRIERESELVALSGTAALLEGATSLRLSATLARETDVGLQVSAGRLVSARVLAVELGVAAFDDIALVRSADERTGLPTLDARPVAASLLAAPPPGAEPARAAPAEAARTAGGGLDLPLVSGPPQRPARPKQEHEEAYPEVGDRVTHFHFGECEIISSDGDRIRLRQERDGRVREVALSMLRIEPPTVDPATGTRHFNLARKN